MYIIFLGAPGAGKGTQAARVARKLKLAHIATGDLFRQGIDKGTALAMQAKSYMEKGKLVPDEITIQMVLERISAPDCQTGVIFDGFPRTLKQAGALGKALVNQGKIIDKVIYIKVAEDELIKRLSRRWICRKCQTPYHEITAPPKVRGKLYQRPDDTTETVKKRLEVYRAETAPLIDYYVKAGKLIEVDGLGGEEEVESRIIKAIDKGTARPKKK
jgi:adenylate kinase